MTKLYIVVPCYNEQEVLPETSKRLGEKLNTLISNNKITADSRVIFVNDGSKDKTWELIESLHKENKLFSGINLSRNRGHQNALLAGLMAVKDMADAVISMDADLQDDINAVDEMLEKFEQGNDVVYGVRSKRETDTFFKRFTAQGFYKLMKIMGADVVYNHADYRLMSSRALNALAEFKEVNLFLRGLVPLVGFKSDKVYYERGERFAGESKYPLKKMLSFAFEGITSLSVKPIELILRVGIIFALFGFGVLIYALVRYIMGATQVGWTSIFGSLWFIGGFLMLSIGIVGKYIGKMYLETKARPRFIIESFIHE